MSIADRSDHLRVIAAPDFPCTEREAFGVEMMDLVKELSFTEPGWVTGIMDMAGINTAPHRKKAVALFALTLVVLNADAIEANMRAVYTPGLSVVAGGCPAPVPAC